MQHTTAVRSRARIKLAKVAAAALGAIALTLGSSTIALAHDELVGQEFTVNANGETDGLMLQFNNNIMDVGTEMLATDPAGADIAGGDPVVEGRDVTQPFKTPLDAGGPYQLAWRVVSSDGHPIQGIVHFEIAEDGTGAIVDAPDDNGEDHDHSEDGHDHSHDAESDEDVTSAEVTSAQEQGTALHPALLIAIAVVAIAVIWIIVAAVRNSNRKKQNNAAPIVQNAETNDANANSAQGDGDRDGVGDGVDGNDADRNDADGGKN